MYLDHERQPSLSAEACRVVQQLWECDPAVGLHGHVVKLLSWHEDVVGEDLLRQVEDLLRLRALARVAAEVLADMSVAGSIIERALHARVQRGHIV